MPPDESQHGEDSGVFSLERIVEGLQRRIGPDGELPDDLNSRERVLVEMTRIGTDYPTGDEIRASVESALGPEGHGLGAYLGGLQMWAVIAEVGDATLSSESMDLVFDQLPRLRPIAATIAKAIADIASAHDAEPSVLAMRLFASAGIIEVTGPWSRESDELFRYPMWLILANKADEIMTARGEAPSWRPR